MNLANASKKKGENSSRQNNSYHTNQNLQRRGGGWGNREGRSNWNNKNKPQY